MIDLKALHLHWRVSHYKGTTYRSYSLAHSYRHHGTNRKDIVLKLGKLSDEEAGRWRALLQAAKTPHTFFTTLNGCIDPAATSKTPHWFRDTALPWLLAIPPHVVNPSRIFRE